MAAKRKQDTAAQGSEPEEKRAVTRPQVENGAAPDAEVTSPARSLQAQLESRLSTPVRRDRIMDIGRVLASASGITLILGVFIISGIW